MTDQDEHLSAVGRPPAGGVPGYSLILPPGWHRLDVCEPERTVERLVETAAAGRSRDEMSAARTQLSRALNRSLDEARARGVFDLFIPLATSEEMIIPASFAVAALETEPGEDPMQVLLTIASRDGTARAVDIAGSVAVRTEVRSEVAPAVRGVLAATEGGEAVDEAAVVDLASGLITRQVRYVLGVPGDSSRWLSVVFTTTVPGDPAAEGVGDAFIELFDAIMTSFSWR